MTLRIEEVAANEMPQVRAIFNEVTAATEGLRDENVSEAGFAQLIARECLLVAKVQDQIAGFVSVYEPANFVHHLYVAVGHQNQGIGSRLLDACEMRFGRPLSLKCLEDNRQACAFYQRLGWVDGSRGYGPNGPYINFVLSAEKVTE